MPTHLPPPVQPSSVTAAPNPRFRIRGAPTNLNHLGLNSNCPCTKGSGNIPVFSPLSIAEHALLRSMNYYQQQAHPSRASYFIIRHPRFLPASSRDRGHNQTAPPLAHHTTLSGSLTSAAVIGRGVLLELSLGPTQQRFRRHATGHGKKKACCANHGPAPPTFARSWPLSTAGTSTAGR